MKKTAMYSSDKQIASQDIQNSVCVELYSVCNDVGCYVCVAGLEDSVEPSVLLREPQESLT